MKVLCIVSLVIMAAVTSSLAAPYNYNGYQRPGYDYQPGIDEYDLQRLGGIYGLVTYGLPSNVRQLYQPPPYQRVTYGNGGYHGAGVNYNRYPRYQGGYH